MAKRTLNRKDLRAEAEAAEAIAATAESLGIAPAGKKAKAEPKTKKPAKRASRAKVAKEVKKKAFWGVFNQSMKRVALFEYADKEAAQKKAEALSTSQKSPHFIQAVKEAIEA